MLENRDRLLKLKRLRAFSDRKSTRLNSSHTVIYTLSLHDALPIFLLYQLGNIPEALEDLNSYVRKSRPSTEVEKIKGFLRSEEHTSELQSHSDLHSFPTRRSSDLLALSTRQYSRGS